MHRTPQLLAGLILPVALAWGTGSGEGTAVGLVADRPLVVTVTPEAGAPPHRLQVESLADGRRRFELARPVEGDLASVVVTVDEQDAREEVLDRLLEAYRTADDDAARRAAAEALVLAVGATASHSLVLDEAGRFVERDSGRVLAADEAWALYAEELEATPSRWRMVGELALAVSVGTILYDTDPEERVRDADFELDLENFRAKFVNFDGWRFDDNLLVTNTPGHALAGGLYYSIARTNGFEPTGAFLVTLTTSLFWELVLEYDEVAAINDLFLTPIGGYSVGETMYQASRFFVRGPGGLLRSTLGFALNPGGTVDRWLAQAPARRARELDRFGFPADTPHRLGLLVGGEGTRATGGVERSDVRLAGNLELFHVREYGEAVPYRAWLRGPVSSRLALTLATGPSGLLDFRLFTRTLIAGRMVQDVRPAPGGPRGFRLFVGVGTAFEHAEHRAGFKDAYGMVHLPGPALDLVLEGGGTRLRWTGEVWPDFSTIRPVALGAFLEDDDLEGTRSVLEREEYYFGWGWSALTRLILERRPFEVGGAAAYHAVDSIDGRDRFQEQITRPVRLADQVLELRGWVAVALPFQPLRLLVQVEHRQRRGALAEVRAERSESRLTGGLQLHF